VVALSSLWLPILLASLAVFFLSFVLHMVATYHLTDYAPLADEDGVRDALRAAGVGAGQYSFPHCGTHETLKSQAFQSAWAQGPTGMLTIFPPGPMTMGKSLNRWFAMTLFVSCVAAWIAGLVLGPGSDWKLVVKITGTVAFMSYGCGELTGPIWKGSTWSSCFKALFDAALYAVATALVFRFFWPEA